MSHMRYAAAPDGDAPSAQPWFARTAASTSYVGRDGVGAHLEAGDAFAFGDALVVGYGPRTEELALKHLADRPRRPGPRASGSPTRRCTTSTWPSARSTTRRAMVCPAALDDGVRRGAARRWCPSRWCSPRRRR